MRPPTTRPWAVLCAMCAIALFAATAFAQDPSGDPGVPAPAAPDAPAPDGNADDNSSDDGSPDASAPGDESPSGPVFPALDCTEVRGLPDSVQDKGTNIQIADFKGRWVYIQFWGAGG